MTMSTTDSPKVVSARPGTAGRTDYDQWRKVTDKLVDEVEQEEEQETAETKKALGLDGKYALSEAEAAERAKAKDLKQTKKALEGYMKRESSIMASMSGLLGDVDEDEDQKNVKNDDEAKEAPPKTIRITRDDLDAGERVVTISDTSGSSRKDTIVLTQDLSLLESKYRNPNAKAKSFQEDAENDVPVPAVQERVVHGIIKCFLSNIHNCTVLIKCKVIAGVLEISHCSNIEIIVDKDATVVTVQADLCQNISIVFKDAPSGKDNPLPGQKRVYWGEDKEDRIFHAGVTNMLVKIIRDDYVETERMCDFIADQAQIVGNATKKEYQFVTSVLDGKLVTEAVIRSGATTGENSRAMTQRELDEEKIKRDQAAKVAIGMAEDMIKILDKDGNPVVRKVAPPVVSKDTAAVDPTVKDILQECETNKTRGNDAFKAGEYGQAILLYSLALDKAAELPDDDVFPRDVVLSNRAACFLKLGQHEKALEDGQQAQKFNPENVKAIFRQGLSLHAMKKYQEALPILAAALKMEPKNKQIQQAIKFAEVRLQQEMRQRTGR